MYICINVHMYICIYVYMYKCIYVYIYISIYVYMYICIYLYIYICIYIVIYIYDQFKDFSCKFRGGRPEHETNGGNLCLASDNWKGLEAPGQLTRKSISLISRWRAF